MQNETKMKNNNFLILSITGDKNYLGLKVTVDFVSEIITCIRDKEKKIVSGSPDKIKTIYDTWTFSRDMRSNNPNWLLVNTLN